MVVAYTGFAAMLVVVAGLGFVLSSERCGIGQRAMDWSAPLVTVLGLLTSAAVVAIAFLADRLAGHDALQPASGDMGTAIMWTVAVLSGGGSGLLCALVGAVFWGSERGRRWAGGCLAVSCLGALVLLPVPVVLIFEAAKATPMSG